VRLKPSAEVRSQTREQISKQTRQQKSVGFSAEQTERKKNDGSKTGSLSNSEPRPNPRCSNAVIGNAGGPFVVDFSFHGSLLWLGSRMRASGLFA
jgi:hypothetical protein